MPDNIDKTRIERIGDRSFSCSGVDTIPDVMEENIDLRQQIQDMINEALANVTGAVVIQDVPDQITYQFGGGGISEAQFNVAISEVYDWINWMADSLRTQIQVLFNAQRRAVTNLQNQINNLESGTGSVPKILCRAYLSGNQVLADANEYLVQLDTESYDPQSVFDTTNHWITIPSDGYYMFTSQLYFESTVASSRHKSIIALESGGANIVSTIGYSDAGTDSHFYVNFTDVQFLSEGQLVGLRVSGPGAGSTLGSNPAGTWLSMAKVGNV